MRTFILLRGPIHARTVLALAMTLISVLGTCLNAGADESLPSSTPDFPSVIRAHADQLAKMASDKDALDLFASAIGPTLRVGDVVRTLKTKSLPPKLAKELLVPDLTAASLRLMGSLAAWHLASTVRQAVESQQLAMMSDRLLESFRSREWLDQQANAVWHDALKQLLEVVDSPEWAKEKQTSSASPLLVTALERAIRLEVDAVQTSYQEWDRIRNWKDRVRGLRGQARLCGTWQWIIHNHQQHHQEQKLLLLFPPAGHTQTTLVGLVETIVLGENVYLRWEIDGRIQEDSLQFSKEGQRLEGTFSNSEGGWGSISAKRTAGCAP